MAEAKVNDAIMAAMTTLKVCSRLSVVRQALKRERASGRCASRDKTRAQCVKCAPAALRTSLISMTFLLAIPKTIPATGLADTFHQPHLSSAIRVFVSTLRAEEWSPFVVGAQCNRTIGARVGTFLLLRARFYWLVCLLATFYIHLHLTVSKHVIAH